MKPEIEEKIKRILPLLPTNAPSGVLDAAINREVVKGNGFVFKVDYRPGDNGRREKCVKVKCSACGGAVKYGYVSLVALEDTNRVCGYSSRYYGKYGFRTSEFRKNGDTHVCELCGYGGTVYNTGKVPTTLDEGYMSTAHNIDGSLVLLQWRIKRILTKDATITHHVHGYDGLALVGGNLVLLRKYYKYFTTERLLADWEYKKKYQHDFGKLSKDQFVDLTPGLLDSTTAAKSALCEYLTNGGCRTSEYLTVWLKYPHIENLARQGYCRLLDDLISRAASYYYGGGFRISAFNRSNLLNMREKKPDRMLGICKTERYAASAGLELFCFFKKLKNEYGVTLNDTELTACYRLGTKNIETLLEKEDIIKPRKLITYLVEQSTKRAHIRASDMIDYLNMLIAYHGRIPPSLIYPNDLHAAHDDYDRKLEVLKQEHLKRGFAEQYEKMKGLEYHSDGLMIRPCANQDELNAEGKTLCHCVARYADSHSKGECCIFFIRREDAPDVPFYTLELRDGRINQNRGKNNCGETPEVITFKAKWFDFIKKKENKNAKRRNKSTGANASA